MFDWITNVINATSYFGVALLMFLENVFPPIPSEIIMPLAGFNAARGELNVYLVLVAGVIGSLAGALLWYWIGRRVGSARLKRFVDRHGRWMTMGPLDIDKSNDWFGRHGGTAVLIGRLIPTVRTFISVPAGVARMPLALFLAYSTVGTAVWTAFLTAAGYVLESQYQRVSQWLNPVSTAVFVLLIGWYVYRVATHDRRMARREAQES